MQSGCDGAEADGVFQPAQKLERRCKHLQYFLFEA